MFLNDAGKKADKKTNRGGGDMKKVKKQHLEHHAAMTLALECQIKMFQVERPAAF